MESDGLLELLRKKGFEVGFSRVDQEGRMHVQVNGVLMLPMDADDLAHDRTTIKQIIERIAGRQANAVSGQ